MSMGKPASLLLALLFFSHCGRKGALYLEPPPQPDRPVALTVRQTGDRVRLQWTLPENLAGGGGAMDLASLGRTTLLMAEREWPAERFRDKAGEWARLKPEELVPAGPRTFAVSRELKAKRLDKRTLYFAVEYEWARQRSLTSAVVSLQALPPPAPVTDLRVHREGKVIILRWSRPAPGAVFDVYRRIAADGPANDPLQRLNAVPLADPYFEDRDLTRDGEYQYQVSVRLSEAVESALSSIGRVPFRDTFPPDTPRELVSFSGRDHVLLSWEKVADPDLAGYRVYRKGPQENGFRVISERVTENSFRDGDVQKGKAYQYAVSAVDARGNESPPSTAVVQKFE